MPERIAPDETAPTIWTIGHSTRTADEFRELLAANAIDLLVDVRSYPGSRRCPWFGRSLMPDWLAPIGYLHLADLGGRRGKQDVDPDVNGGWANLSFRNYADWTTTEPYVLGIIELEHLAADWRVAYCCSEAVPWRCHRTIISDTLTARGWNVRHIISAAPPEPHQLGGWGATPHAEDGRVTYPSDAAQMLLQVM